MIPEEKLLRIEILFTVPDGCVVNDEEGQMMVEFRVLKNDDVQHPLIHELSGIFIQVNKERIVFLNHRFEDKARAVYAMCELRCFVDDMLKAVEVLKDSDEKKWSVVHYVTLTNVSN